MPADTASMADQPPDLYARVAAVRKQSQLLIGRLEAAQRETKENMQLIKTAWGEVERIQAQRLAARTDRDRLRYSAYARLEARLASLPVIEQAKGIIMARHHCSEDQAFDVLRRASQRENVKLRDLAASIVARTARSARAQRRAGRASAAAQSGERILRVGSGRSADRYPAPA